jgi:outer membrane immunogenic protein
MKLKIALAAATVLVAPALMPAHAQQANVYLNGGYTHLDGDSPEVGGITGRVGVGFGSHFAVEGEGTIGVNDDGGAELDNQIGLFGVGKLPITERFDIFGRVGVSRTEFSPGGDADGLAYGVGANYFFTEKDGIRGDVTRHDYDDADVDSYSVSYVRKF